MNKYLRLQKREEVYIGDGRSADEIAEARQEKDAAWQHLSDDERQQILKGR